VLTAHGSIMRADGTPYLTKVNALTGLNLPHAVRFLEIIYNRIDPTLRAKYLVHSKPETFLAGVITERFIEWFNEYYETNFLNYFSWNKGGDEIKLTRLGIEKCFNSDEFDFEDFDPEEPWESLYYYQFFS
jgi:hypothetical protein